MTTQNKTLKHHFEANILDGDDLENRRAALFSGDSVWEYANLLHEEHQQTLQTLRDEIVEELGAGLDDREKIDRVLNKHLQGDNE